MQVNTAWLRALSRDAVGCCRRRCRERHGEQMAAVFANLLRDARRRGGRRLAARTAVAELRDLVWFALGRAPRRCAALRARADSTSVSLPGR